MSGNHFGRGRGIPVIFISRPTDYVTNSVFPLIMQPLDLKICKNSLKCDFDKINHYLPIKQDCHKTRVRPHLPLSTDLRFEFIENIS